MRRTLSSSRPLLTYLLATILGGVAAPASATGAKAREAAPGIDKVWLNPYFRAGAPANAAALYRLDDYRGAVSAFDAALAHMKDGHPEALPSRFLRALALTEAGQSAAAATAFESLHADYPLLADYHAYHAARAHLRAGNAAAALTWVERVDPQAVSDAEAQLVALEALERLEQWEQLEAKAETFLRKYEKGPRRAEARFRFATALEKRGRPASEVIPQYRMIWSLAPLEAWARRAEDRIKSLVPSLPPEAAHLGSPSPEDWFERAKQLHEKNQNGEAEPAFAEALKSGKDGKGGLKDPTSVCEARYLRAQAVFKQRQRPLASALYDEAEAYCRAAGNEDLVVKALYQGARCRASAGDRDTALAKYAIVEKEFPAHSYADDARVRAAELLQDSGDTEGALLMLEAVPKRYAEGDMLGESLFRLAFAAYDGKDYEKALHWLDENLRLIPRETMWFAEGRALYWKGRIYQRQGRMAECRAAFEAAIRTYPLSYYALLAFSRLRELFPKVARELVSELHASLGDDPWPVAFGHSPVYATPGFARAVELARLGLGAEARRELARLDLAEAGNEGERAEGVSLRERALWLSAVLLDRGRVWNASHAIPRYTLTDYKREHPQGARAAAWRLSYPRAFPEYVATHSTANDVPQFLQLAIMREESAFSPTIESFANAIGLTQMLVKTAQRFSDRPVTRETLLDPAQNIALGSRFLGFLLTHFNRTVPLTISGYNAGEGAVDRWLAERGSRPLDEFIEMIPYDETRGYTKRVLSTYFTYTWLYGTGDPVPRLSFSLAPVTKKGSVSRSARRPKARR